MYDITLGDGSTELNELFYRGKARHSRQYNTLRIECGDTVSFSTFFNLYPYYEYYHYCGIDKPVLYLDITGIYTVKIFCMDQNGEPHELVSDFRQGRGIVSTVIPDTKMGSFLYFTITAASACVFHGARWETEKEPERPVKLGLVICTYKREEFLKANMEKLRGAIQKNPVWADRIHVFIVDNAETLAWEEDPLYTVYPNRNLGGSGGFARGMYELSRHEEYTHMLLMDDDIQFSFGTIERTYNILCALTEEHKDAAVGGVMLKLSHPYMQHEFGGLFNGLSLKSVNKDLDMRLEENLLKNQDADTPDYNAWWYCCMPAHFVQDYGLPMPFFIKSDDIEYGLRTYKELILMNGLAVWHQDFDNKYSRVLDYYSRRNFLITAIMHHKCSRFKAAINYAYFMFKGLVLKNYMSVELIYRSFLDVKKGPSFLTRTDPVILNKVINDKAPVYLDKETLETLYGIEDLNYERPDDAGDDKKRHGRVIMFLEAYFPPSMLADETVVTDAGNPAAMDCFRKKTIINYDPVRRQGYVCTFDKAQRRKYRRATIRTVFQFLFFYGKYKKLYSNCSALYSAQSWEKLFFPDLTPDTSKPKGKKARSKTKTGRK